MVRERDTVFGRPVIIGPQSNWAGARKAAEILVAWQPRCTGLTTSQFDDWLDKCPERALPGMPLWIGFSTQFDEAHRRQVAALAHSNMLPLPVDGQELDTFVRLACVHG